MTIYIVDIEAVDTRYTKQWKEYLPNQMQRATNEEVKVISGGEVPQATTPGAFLNFGGTNVYKSNQLQQIATMFCKGRPPQKLHILRPMVFQKQISFCRYWGASQTEACC